MSDSRNHDLFDDIHDLSMKKINSIFVYGTLQPGKQHYHILKNLNGTWKKGYVMGTLFNINRSDNYGYPAIKIDKNGSKIYGMLLKSKDLEQKIFQVDEFEGKEYKRIITEVILEDNTKAKAYIYELR